MGLKLRLSNSKAYILKDYYILFFCVLLALGRGMGSLGLGEAKTRKTEPKAKVCPKESNHQSSITSPKGYNHLLCVWAPVLSKE